MTDFANILFGGPCNRRCPFCIGRQLPTAVQRDNLREFPPRNLDGFLAAVRDRDIRQVVLTGTTTDPQLYRHEAQLLATLRQELPHVTISLHTNGALALRKLEVFNQYDKACISFPSFEPAVYEQLMGSRKVPALAEIVRRSRIPLKVSCILTEANHATVGPFLSRCREIGIPRVVLRRLLGERREWHVLEDLAPSRFYRGNPVYDLDGMEVTLWNFDTSESTSINLFPDGTLGSSYLLTQSPEFSPPAPASAPRPAASRPRWRPLPVSARTT